MIENECSDWNDVSYDDVEEYSSASESNVECRLYKDNFKAISCRVFDGTNYSDFVNIEYTSCMIMSGYSGDVDVYYDGLDPKF